MFGNNDGKQQPISDFGNVSLPQQQTAPQFGAISPPVTAGPAFPPVQPLEQGQPLPDMTIPELPVTGTADPGPQDTPAIPPVPVPDDLPTIKQQALSQLTPLVGQLDQTPEEKFRTTMMMIQASDDQSLIKIAYEAAQGIQDEKARAQALLDIINEINYFTQKNQQES